MSRKNWSISSFNNNFPKNTIAGKILLFLLITGCGYQFTPAGEHIDPRIQKVFFDNFSNRTSEPYVENYLRNAFIDEFIEGRRFRLVGSPEMADAILKGSIKSLTTSHLSYDINNIAVEERITVTMEIVFEERDTKKIIWMNKNLSAVEDYWITDQLATESNRKNALIKLSNDTAEKVYRMIVSGF